MLRLGFSFFVVGIALVASLPADAQQKSPHETVDATVGGSKVSIVYGRPYAKGRKIWGELVPWGKAWRAGADQATTLITEAPLKIGDTMVPEGKYTLYMVPDEKGTTKLAISKTVGKWGIPVDEKNDLARVDMKKGTVGKSVEQFTIAIDADKSQPSGVLKMTWETMEFSVPFTVTKK
jgi:hypothetical protein